MPYVAGTPGQVFHTSLDDRCAAALTARGISLHALDQAGHGRTDGEREHTGPAVDLVLARVDAGTAEEVGA